MKNNVPFYLYKLKETYSYKKRVNPNYSLRAFATYLDINSSHLSAVFNEKRCLPLKVVDTVALKLKLSPQEREEFVQSIIEKNKKIKKTTITKNNKNILNEETHFKIISEWEHYAILSLIKTIDFKSDIKWIAARLGITKERSEIVLENLLRSGMIDRTENGEIVRTSIALDTTDNTNSIALRKSYEEHFLLAKEKMLTVDVKNRDYSSITLAINPKDIDEVKKLIYLFEDKVSQLERANSSEVYQLGIQFFPLTNLLQETLK